MSDWSKRFVGYGLSAAVGGLLVYGGFFYRAAPDLMTMLGSVEVQLTQATMMSADDEPGGDVPSSRARLLSDVSAWLDQVDEAYPETAWSPWYRGYMAYLNGDYRDAASLYAEARRRPDCDEDLRDKSVINEALMLRQAGEPDAAAYLLRWHQFPEHHAALVEGQLAALAALTAAPADISTGSSPR